MRTSVLVSALCLAACATQQVSAQSTGSAADVLLDTPITDLLTSVQAIGGGAAASTGPTEAIVGALTDASVSGPTDPLALTPFESTGATEGTVFEGAVDELSSAATQVEGAASSAVSELASSAGAIVSSASEAVSSAVSAAESAVSGIESTIQGVIPSSTGGVGAIVDSVQSSAEQAVDSIQSSLEQPIDSLASSAGSVVNSIESGIENFGSSAESFIDNLGNSAGSEIDQLINSAVALIPGGSGSTGIADIIANIQGAQNSASAAKMSFAAVAIVASAALLL